MAELKTKPNDASVEAFINAVEDEGKRVDCLTLLEMMTTITNESPKMWGGSIIGFGTYHYKYPTGREGDWFKAGFSPRKQNLSLYIMSGFGGCNDLLQRLGKFKTGRSCLYIKRLSDIDINVLKEMITRSVEAVGRKNS